MRTAEHTAIQNLKTRRQKQRSSVTSSQMPKIRLGLFLEKTASRCRYKNTSRISKGSLKYSNPEKNMPVASRYLGTRRAFVQAVAGSRGTDPRPLATGAGRHHARHSESTATPNSS